MNFANQGNATGTSNQAPTQIPGMDGSNKVDWSKVNGNSSNNTNTTTNTSANPNTSTDNTNTNPPAPTGIMAKLEAKYGKNTPTVPKGFETLFAQVETKDTQTHNANPNSSETNTPEATNHWDTSSESLGKKFGYLDVAQYVKPELVTKALSGDVPAMMEMLNTSIKMASMASYRQAMEDAKSGVGSETAALSGKLPDMFKELSVSKTLGEDPILSAPQFKPIVEHVRTALLAKYPQASEADVKEAVHEYLNEMNSTISSSKQNTQTLQTSGEPDWNKLFTRAMG